MLKVCDRVKVVEDLCKVFPKLFTAAKIYVVHAIDEYGGIVPIELGGKPIWYPASIGWKSRYASSLKLLTEIALF